ncbi:MAG: hypothetical protein NT116_02525 [Candidatus Parcubacteria bacterium]|nr:hypothetical protein [Candidatus Parcubacteria bacterium]
MRAKWTTFFANPLKTFAFNLNPGTGDLGSRTADLNNLALDNSILGKWDKRFCNPDLAATKCLVDVNFSSYTGPGKYTTCEAFDDQGPQTLYTVAAVPLISQDIICKDKMEIQDMLKEYGDHINTLMEALRFDMDFAVNCKKSAGGITGRMKIWDMINDPTINLAGGHQQKSFNCSMSEFGEEQVDDVGKAYQEVIEVYRGKSTEGIQLALSNSSNN